MGQWCPTANCNLFGNVDQTNPCNEAERRCNCVFGFTGTYCDQCKFNRIVINSGVFMEIEYADIKKYTKYEDFTGILFQLRTTKERFGRVGFGRVRFGEGGV